MPLHIDYRPDDFDSVFGNGETIAALESILSRDDKPHAYLLYGESGCGKTTLARIIADKLGCTDPIEINSANNRGIDTAREIVQQCRYKPINGESRVWILDEAHQTTKDFQNALLKALEDAPDYSYFVLCTTDPQKLLKTIRGRCSSFQVNLLGDEELKDLLVGVCNAEDKLSNDDVLDIIIKKSEGSPRQALVILEQVIYLPEYKQLTSVNTIKTEEAQVIELCQALSKKLKWSKIGKILKALDAEPEQVRRAVLGYFTSILIKEDNAYAAWVLECFSEPFYNTGKPGLVLACYQAIQED